MPVINFESSLDRTWFESGRHVGKRITQDRDSDFARRAGGAK
ncbi:hypothetical protein NTJ56_35170 [Burkholderia contaminans]|nr:hypothetical protein [Burkholderia contaminans]UUX42852.1 hypothetical protein NTJ56_35170 [Burkholderia contaminans]